MSNVSSFIQTINRHHHTESISDTVELNVFDYFSLFNETSPIDAFSVKYSLCVEKGFINIVCEGKIYNYEIMSDKEYKIKKIIS